MRQDLTILTDSMICRKNMVNGFLVHILSKIATSVPHFCFQCFRVDMKLATAKLMTAIPQACLKYLLYLPYFLLYFAF